MPLLTLENACLAFGHHALLNQAALQLDPGERVGLIGRNGSGKSSLLAAIGGRAMACQGRILLGGTLLLPQTLPGLPVSISGRLAA